MSYIVPRSIPKKCIHCDFSKLIVTRDDEIECTLERIYVRPYEKYAFCPLVDIDTGPLFSKGYAEEYLKNNPPKGATVKKEVKE